MRNSNLTLSILAFLLRWYSLSSNKSWNEIPLLKILDKFFGEIENLAESVVFRGLDRLKQIGENDFFH